MSRSCVVKGVTYVAGTGKVHGPVLVTVACSRPLALTVDVVVSDGNSVGSAGSEDNVLTPNVRGSNMVNPNKIRAVDLDSITTPNVLRVQLGDVDVLNDDVLSTLDVKTLALDNTIGTDTHDRLIRVDDNGVESSLIVGNVDLGGVGLVVVAPVILVDSLLTTGTGAPRSTALLGCGSLGSGEVEFLVEEDNAGGAVTEHRDQLVGGLGVGSLSVASACDLRGESLGGTSHTGSGNVRDQRGNGHGEDRKRLHLGRKRGKKE